jgi:electron transfer flavoprotein beta subunit
MKAKKKEMDIQPVDSLGIDVAPRLELISVEPPATRQAGIKVESVEELVSKLKNEAKVIS